MKTLAVALCSLTLLAACGERGGTSQTGEKPAPDAAQVEADVEASQEAATAAIDKAQREREDASRERDGPRRAADYKRTMLALIAGSYTGDCSDKSGPLPRGAVTVDPDGRVSAPGLQAHSLMDPGSMLTLSMKGARGEPSEITFLGSNEPARWSVSSTRRGELTTVFSDRGNPIKCVDARPPAQGRVATLYQALSKHISEGAGTLMCTDGKARPQSQRVVPTVDSLSIGDHTLTLEDDGADEVATVNGGDGTLTYRRESRDGEKIVLTVNPGGGIESLSVNGYRGARIGTCTRETR